MEVTSNWLKSFSSHRNCRFDILMEEYFKWIFFSETYYIWLLAAAFTFLVHFILNCKISLPKIVFCIIISIGSRFVVDAQIYFLFSLLFFRSHGNWNTVTNVSGVNVKNDDLYMGRWENKISQKAFTIIKVFVFSTLCTINSKSFIRIDRMMWWCAKSNNKTKWQISMRRKKRNQCRMASASNRQMS